nr:transposase [Listeria ivanovii]
MSNYNKEKWNIILGITPHSREDKEDDNRCNGYGNKTVKSSCGEVPMDVPRDCSGTFELQFIPKRQKDVSLIENKVLAMYACGMSQRDIVR